MFGFSKKEKELKIVNDIIADLEVSYALDIINKHINGNISYESRDFQYFYFTDKRHSGYFPGKIKLTTNFSLIKVYDYNKNITQIIDLTTKNLKIEKEFKDLFEGLALQYQGNIKLKQYMKDTLLNKTN